MKAELIWRGGLLALLFAPCAARAQGHWAPTTTTSFVITNFVNPSWADPEGRHTSISGTSLTADVD